MNTGGTASPTVFAKKEFEIADLLCPVLVHGRILL
jgi:hypothetical protein